LPLKKDKELLSNSNEDETPTLIWRGMRTLLDFYRCPTEFISHSMQESSTPQLDRSRFGENAIYSGSSVSKNVSPFKEDLLGRFSDVTVANGIAAFPFSPDDAVDALRLEKYCGDRKRTAVQELVWNSYYFIRPLLDVPVRRYLQKLRVRNWRDIQFPAWPVDCTVEQLHARVLQLCMEAKQVQEVPFIWFWPHGYSSCVAMTHDVETTTGRDFCHELINLDESHGIKGSFQIVPMNRYAVTQSFLDSIRLRGCEINIHDLCHDGRLFANAAKFPEKARLINQFARNFGARGFRSGALHHKLEWYKGLHISYDMSVPNTARLDPQCGGCCTVMPYFIGGILEIPLTTTQDYSLFHLLDDYSIALWKEQLAIIRAHYGLAVFNVHPDYIIERRARKVYEQLLGYLAETRNPNNVWHARPAEVDQWWRDRASMQVVRRGDSYVIEGPNSNLATLAYASLDDRGVRYEFQMERRPIDTRRSTA
jgi:hypothetical protein